MSRTRPIVTGADPVVLLRMIGIPALMLIVFRWLARVTGLRDVFAQK